MSDANCSSSASSVGLVGRWDAGSAAAWGVGAAGRSTGDFGGVVGRTASSVWANGSASVTGTGDGVRGGAGSVRSVDGASSRTSAGGSVALRSSGGSRRTGGTLKGGVASRVGTSWTALDEPAPVSTTGEACPSVADSGVGACGRAGSSGAAEDGPSRLGGTGRWACMGCRTWSGTQPGAMRRIRSCASRSLVAFRVARYVSCFSRNAATLRLDVFSCPEATTSSAAKG